MLGHRCVLGLLVSALVAVAATGTLQAQIYSDDFERADGPVDGWTNAGGNWEIAGGELVGGPPSGAEQQIFAGDPALVLPDSYRLSFDIRWSAPEGGGVGRHGGVMFNFQGVGPRGSQSGYLVWWIDRAADKGLNLTRRDGGGFNHLVVGPGAANAPADPPERWTIEVVGPTIRVYGDGTLYIEHVDSTYRGGRFAMFTWNGEGQHVAIDNVLVEGIVLADNFSRSPVPNWTPVGGNWSIDGESETLRVGPTGGEIQIYAGSPPVSLPEEFSLSVDMAYLAPGTHPVVGRHASVNFNYQEATARNGSDGYQVFWIDRGSDFGLNLVRWDGGALVPLDANGTGDLFADPPANLRIEVDGDTIRVYGDDVLAIEAVDTTYRGGLFAIWSWTGGQELQVDNVIATAGDETLFEDTFTPGPISLGDWTVIEGLWEIVDVDGDNALRAGPAGATEQSIFANATLPADFVASVDIDWIAPQGGGVGRHGGVYVCWQEPSGRTAGNGNGYHIWWIDRAADRGWNLFKQVNGTFNTLVSGTAPAGASPDGALSIEVAGDSIRVHHNGELVIDHDDSQFRRGHIGLWTWAGKGQNVDFDDVVVFGDPVQCIPCFAVTTDAPRFPGEPVSFDAGCGFGNITSYSWDFGDGQSDSGEQTEHTYDESGTYTVTLAVEGPDGCQESVSQDIEIACVESYECDGSVASDDFEDGDLDGWTVSGGTWNVDDGVAVAGPAAAGGAGAEQHLFLDQAVPNDEVTIQFDWEFLSSGNVAGVGRHAGIYFCWTGTGVRWDGGTRGYQLWWIDRAQDRGLVLADWNPGLSRILHPGTFDLFPEPPQTIRIQIDGPRIRVFGDDVCAIDIEDTTHRGSQVALWTWEQGQHVRFDNFCIDGPRLAPCFEVAKSGPTVVGGSITFDGDCTSVADDVEDIPLLSWDFGDGNGDDGNIVRHTYAEPGTYTVTMTAEIPGEVRSFSRDIAVSPLATEFEDGFDAFGVELGPWTVAAGAWSRVDGRLTTGPTGAEHWIWAGAPPEVAPGNSVFEFDYEFLAPGTVPSVGRHGGFAFCCDDPSSRGVFRGYYFDWIDRDSDRGIRLTRSDGAPDSILVNGQGVENAPADPPTHYRVEINGPRIRIWGDDELYIDIVDNTYRGGFFGFWTWAGGQEVAVDNFEQVESSLLSPCFESRPGALLAAGQVGTFDASCAGIFCDVDNIEFYTWDFGDGSDSRSGVEVTHAYETPGTFPVTLTIEDSDGNDRSVSKDVTVFEEKAPFADCFERAAGALDGWTVPLGAWSILGNETAATATTTGNPDAESWAWCGDPAGATGEPNLAIQFDVTSVLFTGSPLDSVRRHFGVMFYSNVVTTNRTAPDSSGYGLWWIDRTNDRGVSLTRLDGTQRTMLASGAGSDLDGPPGVWRVEIDGTVIRVFGDDVLLIEVEDETYRTGHLGFWAWKNMSLGIDNVRVGRLGELPQCAPVGGAQRACDFNQDGRFDLSDAVSLLAYLFTGGASPPCGDGTIADPANQALLDANGDGNLDISDAAYKLNYLFTGGPAPIPGGQSSCLLIPGCPDTGCVE